MKFDCKVIEDLIPLYLDNVCSDESRNIVEEHLQECEKCRALIDKMPFVKVAHIDKDESEKISIAKRGFKKIHRRWLTSLIATFMLIPIIFLGIMGYNEAHSAGIAFTNFDDIYRCLKYLHYIKNGNYEKAVQMVDFSENDYQLVDSVKDMTPDEYQKYMSERFVTKLKEYQKLGISIKNIRYDSAYRWDNGVWCICVSIDEVYPDGSKQKIVIHMDGETMLSGAYSYPSKSETERDDYIDEILNLYSEDEALWYQDFDVTFELKEGEKAIIRRNKNKEIDNTDIINLTYGTGTSMIEEPYYQDTFETSVAGKYSVFIYDNNGKEKFLTREEIEIEIISYD